MTTQPRMRRKSALSGLSAVKPRPLPEAPDPAVEVQGKASTKERDRSREGGGQGARTTRREGQRTVAARTNPGRLSVNFWSDQDYHDMRSAYQLEYQHNWNEEIVNLKTWFARAVEDYATMTPDDRQRIRAELAEARQDRAPHKIVRSLDVDARTKDAIAEAVYRDYKHGAKVSASAFAAEAIAEAVRRTEDRHPRPWPVPDGRLPSKPEPPRSV